MARQHLGITYLKAGMERAAYRARWIVLSPGRILENGYITVKNGLIRFVGSGRPSGFDGHVSDLGPGVIMPCLVNAHVHLELSALENVLDCSRGFSAWVQALLKAREAMGHARLREAAEQAALRLAGQGTGAIGEISTLGITRDVVKKHVGAGIWFREVLGGSVPDIETDTRGLLSFSMAGHAPHTTAPEVLRAMKKGMGNQVFSIHLAESREESEFLDTGRGPWAKFLASRGIDISDWPLGRTSPVAYLQRLGLLDETTLAVHLLRANADDLDVIRETGTKVCLCPRSNHCLHGRLPDMGSMLSKGIMPALGTDSLASCDSLSMFDEMAFVRRMYPEIPPETVLAMATVNGAHALGICRAFGALVPGCQARFLYLPVTIRNKNQLIESLTNNDF